MTKTEIIEKAAADANITKTEAAKVLNSIVDSVKGSLKKGKKVMLIGFGTFSVVKRKARTGRNPQTGEQLKIKAGKSPKFTPAKALKDSVK